MDDNRFEWRLEHLTRALAALQAALAQPENEFIRDSIIKRFELAFEAARKAMRQWLVEQEELGNEATKKQVMEAAFRTGLIHDPDLWDEIGAARNDTSHEYDENRAMEVAAFIRQRAVQALSELRETLERCR